MKKANFLLFFAVLLGMGFSVLPGCAKLNTATGPVNILNPYNSTPTPQSSCLIFSSANVPLSPLGNGNYVIRNTADWETYNNCAGAQNCPVPPVDFQSQMLLVTETLYSAQCTCTPLSEAVSSVCSDGSVLTVKVHQTLPAGCGTGATATPVVCTLGPVTLESAVAVSTSSLPVTWAFDGN